MKHKSKVATGEFLIIVFSLVAFHCCSLMLHSSLWEERTPNNNKNNSKEFKETISNAI